MSCFNFVYSKIITYENLSSLEGDMTCKQEPPFFPEAGEVHRFPLYHNKENDCFSLYNEQNSEPIGFFSLSDDDLRAFYIENQSILEHASNEQANKILVDFIEDYLSSYDGHKKENKEEQSIFISMR